MGTNVAVICANLYLTDFDNYFSTKVIFYQIYIDDIFFIFRGTNSELQDLFKEMNNFYNYLSLNFELSQLSVNFLDLTIYKDADNKLQYCTFYKEVQKFLYIPLF